MTTLKQIKLWMILLEIILASNLFVWNSSYIVYFGNFSDFVLFLSLFGGQPSQMQKLCRSGDMVLFVGWEGWVELILTFRLLAASLVPQKKQHSCKSRTDSQSLRLVIVISVSYYYCHSYLTLLHPRVGLVLHKKTLSSRFRRFGI